uniref:DNA ligase (NAD(+)) n=1 Tax=virus sp. ctuZj11 TaxID=2825825 RepID=A0A8S5RB82_9VIRU|nr:MAG TPA: DNA ligase [virus sp. ctuZj11]
MVDLNEYTDSLANRIKRHNEEYRAGHPTISDAEYDRLVEELKEKCPSHEWFRQQEPAPVASGRKRKLPIPMKSLDKVKSFAGLQDWVRSLGLPQTTAVVITPKFDGVSWLHNERTGETYSRGGSENEGQDCTAHYKKAGFDWRDMTHHSFDIHTPTPEYVYGELCFFRHSWETEVKGKISESSGEPYRSPRNTVAGFINSDTPSHMLRHTHFYRYGVDEGSLDLYLNYDHVISWLCKHYNQQKMHVTVKVSEITHDLLFKLFEEWRSLIYIDGLVIYLNDLNLWRTIGRHQTTGNPMYAIAYKHPDFTDTFETTVKGISWRVNKSGALKPVVNIDAVDTGDCIMENPTAYNASWVNNSYLCPGARILVTRSGGVIPKILSVIEYPGSTAIEKVWDEVAECPSCGSPTRWDQNFVELLCTNQDCAGRKLAKLVFFFRVIGCDNVGEEVLTKIFDAGYTSIRSVLDMTFDEILKINGLGESVANTLVDFSKNTRKGVDAATLMQASDCFKGIGKVKAQKYLDDMSEEEIGLFFDGGWLAQFTPKLTDKAFRDLPVTLQNLALGYLSFMDFIKETGIKPIVQQTTPLGDKLKDYKVCFSGIRDAQLEEHVRKNGGTVMTSVTKNTTHLVVKDVKATSTKINRARELGIKIMGIEQFRKKIAD